MEQLSKATIVYSGFETKSGIKDGRVWNKYKVKDENGKGYSFFQHKKDGSDTRAFTDFSKLNVGDRVEVAYSEEPGIHNGKTVTYRTAKFFSRVSDMAPVTSSTAPNVSIRIAPDALQSLTKRVEVLEGLVTQMAGDKAFQVHTELHDYAKKDKSDTIPVIEPGVNIDEIPF